jgi:transposase
MARGQGPDAKQEALRRRGCLHPHPEKVDDEHFRRCPFFDARDLVQVKYEMLRCVRVDGESISRAAVRFGLSRPTFYGAQAALEQGGLPALVPRRPGPRRAHKLGEEVVDFLEQTLAEEPTVRPAELVELVRRRFGLSVHRRSVERALQRRGKKRR